MITAQEFLDEVKEPKPTYKAGDKVKLKHLPGKGPFPITKSKYDKEQGEWQYLVDQKWRSESNLEKA